MTIGERKVTSLPYTNDNAHHTDSLTSAWGSKDLRIPEYVLYTK